jgi:hypothetical protein
MGRFIPAGKLRASHAGLDGSGNSQSNEVNRTSRNRSLNNQGHRQS